MTKIRLFQLEDEIEKQKNLKMKCIECTLDLVTKTEESIYKDTTFSLLDVSAAFYKYFEEGVRQFKRQNYELQGTKEEFMVRIIFTTSFDSINLP